MTDIETVRQRISAHYEKSKSWEVTRKHFKISKAMAWMIVNENHEPKDPQIRKTLGLPELIVVPVERDRRGRFK